MHKQRMEMAKERSLEQVWEKLAPMTVQNALVLCGTEGFFPMDVSTPVAYCLWLEVLARSTSVFMVFQRARCCLDTKFVSSTFFQKSFLQS